MVGSRQKRFYFLLSTSKELFKLVCEESCRDCVSSSRTDPSDWMGEATLAAAWDRTPPDPGPVLSSVMERQLQEEKC